MTLRDLAHARTGDKGDICNISLIVFDPRDYPRIIERVTPERVRAHFAGIVQGDIKRFELPHLGAVNFVMTRALRGGVTRSLALDPHRKSLSGLLLNLEI